MIARVSNRGSEWPLASQAQASMGTLSWERLLLPNLAQESKACNPGLLIMAFIGANALAHFLGSAFKIGPGGPIKNCLRAARPGSGTPGCTVDCAAALPRGKRVCLTKNAPSARGRFDAFLWLIE